MKSPLFSQSPRISFLISLLLAGFLWCVLTAGAFVLDREFYVNLTLHSAALHIFLAVCVLAIMILGKWGREMTPPSLPNRLFSSFLNAGPGVSVSILFVSYFLTQFITLYFMHLGMETSLWDFGFNDAIIWSSAHGKPLFLSVRGGQNALGEHFTPIFLLLAPVYRLTDNPNAMFFVQSLAIASCLPLVYGIARKLNVSRPTALCLAVAVFFYQPMRNGLLHPFQAQTFADPFLLFGFYLLLHRLNWGSLLAFAIALLCKENIVMEVLGIGMFAVFQRRKTGWAIVFLAVSFFLLNTRLIEPAYQFANNWNKWGYYHHITHPSVNGWLDWAKSFFSFVTLKFLALIFLPLLLLPLQTRGWFFLLGPSLTLRLMTSFIGFRIITAHYTAGLNALLFIAAAYALSRIEAGQNQFWNTLSKRLQFKSLGSFMRYALVIAALLFAGVPQLFRLENDLWEASNPSNQRMAKMLRIVPSSFTVAATQNALAQLTHRHYIFGLDTVMPGSPLEETARSADLVFADQLKIQPNELRTLQDYQVRGFGGIYQHKALTAFAHWEKAENPEIVSLVEKWRDIENQPDIPYRKIARRLYKKLLIAFSILFLAKLIFETFFRKSKTHV